VWVGKVYRSTSDGLAGVAAWILHNHELLEKLFAMTAGLVAASRLGNGEGGLPLVDPDGPRTRRSGPSEAGAVGPLW
jgi:hypothetical protein